MSPNISRGLRIRLMWRRHHSRAARRCMPRQSSSSISVRRDGHPPGRREGARERRGGVGWAGVEAEEMGWEPSGDAHACRWWCGGCVWYTQRGGWVKGGRDGLGPGQARADRPVPLRREGRFGPAELPPAPGEQVFSQSISKFRFGKFQTASHSIQPHALLTQPPALEELLPMARSQEEVIHGRKGSFRETSRPATPPKASAYLEMMSQGYQE